MRIGIVQLIIFLLLSPICLAQNDKGELVGEVTFVTSQNVYVKFANTEKISIGDTLIRYKDNRKDYCLLVKAKSSGSCLCSVIGEYEIEVKDLVIFTRGSLNEKNLDVIVDAEAVLKSSELSNERLPAKTFVNSGNIRGRISVASYSNFTDGQDTRHRTMYRLSLNADRIDSSKFSLETYLNYRQSFVNGESSSSSRARDFNVYSLALKYNVDPTMSVSVGRKINTKASSLGAIDGIQAEKYFGNFYTGIIAGFRPDIFNYDFNSDLFEYGGYLGLKSERSKVFSQTTLGLLQQNNAGNIDREYAYFQHTSTFNRKLNVFSSIELDLYDNVNGVSVTDARLTNLYVSTRYRFSRALDINVSYDSRKRIVFYETFKTEIEQILDEDIARQGVRLRVNLRPMKYSTIGLSYSKRFQASSQNESDNINGYLSLSKLPSIGGRMYINLNSNRSNYMKTEVVSVRHSRYLLKQKLYFDLYYRVVNYKYLDLEYFEDRDSKYKQNYYGASFSYNINRRLTFTVLGELAHRDTDDNYRVNARVIKRFDNKKRK